MVNILSSFPTARLPPDTTCTHRVVRTWEDEHVEGLLLQHALPDFALQVVYTEIKVQALNAALREIRIEKKGAWKGLGGVPIRMKDIASTQSGVKDIASTQSG